MVIAFSTCKLLSSLRGAVLTIENCVWAERGTCHILIFFCWLLPAIILLSFTFVAIISCTQWQLWELGQCGLRTLKEAWSGPKRISQLNWTELNWRLKRRRCIAIPLLENWLDICTYNLYIIQTLNNTCIIKWAFLRPILHPCLILFPLLVSYCMSIDWDSYNFLFIELCNHHLKLSRIYCNDAINRWSTV